MGGRAKRIGRNAGSWRCQTPFAGGRRFFPIFTPSSRHSEPEKIDDRTAVKEVCGAERRKTTALWLPPESKGPYGRSEGNGRSTEGGAGYDTEARGGAQREHEPT